MARQPLYEVQCQAPNPNPRLARQGEVHGARLGSTTQPFRYTRRILDDVNQVRRAPDASGSVHAAWCPRCHKATEYEVVAARSVA